MAFTIFKRRPKGKDTGLERGWEFYSRPNTLEPVGYVFRIDENGVRIPVTNLNVETTEGIEAGVKVTQRLEVKAGVLARFLELIDLSADANVGRTRVLEFEIHDPVRTSSTDMAVDPAIKDFLSDFTGKKGSRYFVIRQTRSAKSMTFRLTADLVAELGGEGKVTSGLKASAKLNVDRAGSYEIHQAFPERLLVTFQPDRIERVTAGLVEGGAYDLTPNEELLDWREPAS